MNRGKRILLGILAAVGLALGAAGGEMRNFSEPVAVWDAFLAALRAGKMADAYNCVAPRVRQQLSYRDFCVAWHPLTRNYQAVLEPPVFSEFCIAGEIACLRLGVRESAGRDANFMHAYLVREGRGWWLVALDPKIAAPVVAEADGRNFLRQLWRQSAMLRESLRVGNAVALKDLQKEMPGLFAQESVRRVFAYYELEIDPLRDGAARLRPRNKNVRCWEIRDGELALRTPTPPRAVTTDALAVAAKKAAEKAAREQRAAAQSAAEKAAATSLPPQTPKGKTRVATLPPAVTLPEPPPEFGNPDEIVRTPAPIIAKSRPRAFDKEPLMPEIDDNELLMTPPGGTPAGKIPVTRVRFGKRAPRK